MLTKEKHEKVLQDDIFGKAKHDNDHKQWVYIAEIKQKDSKSYFNEGSGKPVFKHDFGETYENVKEVAIFIWHKPKKAVFKIELDESIIPCCPSFLNG